MNNKIYPKTWQDDWGIKFFFDHLDTHYTMRFAGKPILFLEEMYKYLWWWDNKYENKEVYQQAVEYTEDLLTVIHNISKRGLSPFVIYPNKKKQIWTWTTQTQDKKLNEQTE